MPLIRTLQERIDRYLRDHYDATRRIRLERLQLSLDAQVEALQAISVCNNHMALLSRDGQMVLLDLEDGTVLNRISLDDSINLCEDEPVTLVLDRSGSLAFINLRKHSYAFHHSWKRARQLSVLDGIECTAACFVNQAEGAVARLLVGTVDGRLLDAQIFLKSESSSFFSVRKQSDHVSTIWSRENDRILCLEYAQIEAEMSDEPLASQPLLILIVALSSGSVYAFGPINLARIDEELLLEEAEPIHQFQGNRLSSFTVGPFVPGFEAGLPFVGVLADDERSFGCLFMTADGRLSLRIDKTTSIQSHKDSCYYHLPSHHFQFEISRIGTIKVIKLDDGDDQELFNLKANITMAPCMDMTRGTYWVGSGDADIYELCQDRESTIWIHFMQTGQYPQALRYAMHQRDRIEVVQLHQAARALREGDYEVTASSLARTSSLDIEMVGGELHNLSGSSQSLIKYLSDLLQHGHRRFMSNQRMALVAAWLFECLCEEAVSSSNQTALIDYMNNPVPKHYLNQKALYESLVRLGLYEAALIAATNAINHATTIDQSTSRQANRVKLIIDLLEAEFYLGNHDGMARILLDGWRSGALNEKVAAMIIKSLFAQVSKDGPLRESCREIMANHDFHQRHLLGLIDLPAEPRAGAAMGEARNAVRLGEGSPKVEDKKKSIARLKSETIDRLNDQFEAIHERLSLLDVMTESASRILQ